jgi:hypothetical protein
MASADVSLDIWNTNLSFALWLRCWLSHKWTFRRKADSRHKAKRNIHLCHAFNLNAGNQVDDEVITLIGFEIEDRMQQCYQDVPRLPAASFLLVFVA